MFNLNNCIFTTPKSLYDSGTGFIKNHPVLTLGAATLTSAAVAAYFFSDLSASSFPAPQVKESLEKGMFFNKITTKIEIDQIKNPTLYERAVNFIKTGTFAVVEKTPQTLSLSERYEFSNLANLFYYPAASALCATAGATLVFLSASCSKKNLNKVDPAAEMILGTLASTVTAFLLTRFKESFLKA